MRRGRGKPLTGWLTLDKPAGMSSARAVAHVRRVLDASRAGHAGSLDPMATGVLPIALGEATKTVAFVMRAPKEYAFTLRWGATTRSHDADGEILAEDPTAAPPEEAAIIKALPGFCGLTSQLPPEVSALKVGGKRAYALVRAGITPELAPREVWVGALRLDAHRPEAGETDFFARVGKGFYIRAFARDLATKLGVLGHVSRLRRLSVGPFLLDTASRMAEDGTLATMPSASALAPLGVALAATPRARLSSSEAARLRRGQTTFARTPLEPGKPWLDGAPIADDADADAAVFACEMDGKPVALARLERGALKPVRVFTALGAAIGETS